MKIGLWTLSGKWGKAKNQSETIKIAWNKVWEKIFQCNFEVKEKHTSRKFSFLDLEKRKENQYFL